MFIMPLLNSLFSHWLFYSCLFTSYDECHIMRYVSLSFDMRLLEMHQGTLVLMCFDSLLRMNAFGLFRYARGLYCLSRYGSFTSCRSDLTHLNRQEALFSPNLYLLKHQKHQEYYPQA